MTGLRFHLLLFILGFLGILSALPVVPKLLELQVEQPPMPMWVIQSVSVIQSSVLLLLMIWLGAAFSKKVGLASPVIQALAEPKNIYQKIKPQVLPALLGGIAGGLFLVLFFNAVSSYLPSDFIVNGEQLAPPWYTKILYGGITEEILIRWGLMSFLVWVCYRLTQPKGTDVKAVNYLLGIILSSLLFGAGHLPIAFALSSEVTAFLSAYILIGNAAFGVIAGYLYWKHGLECAMGAHMVAHMIMIVGG